VINKDGAEYQRRPQIYFLGFFLSILANENFSGGPRMTSYKPLHFGPDVERIGKALNITPPEADHLINEAMKRRYQKRDQYRRRPA
jgi:hypothetical protein